jgi:phage N-6-adenine-methyltransferase
MTMPIQKPGQSRQDWATPPELLNAVRRRLHIENFALDVAASSENSVCDFYYTEEDNALGYNRIWKNENDPTGWIWCNPPYGDITPWVRKAALESMGGSHIAVLVPLSLAEWWMDWVEPYAYQIHLHGRIKFVGAEQGYPKDCSLLLYTPARLIGKEVWDWKRSMPKLCKPESGKNKGVPEVPEL